ncbi:hypothetical protein QBC36DRAFT_347232 [Triangularia setosa]|uniref:Uncharacterized protein n=1 Tax=Triangularia setosa TaxID=2587417 RepID=A0AAN6W504_9PEZI|nr:hypothetical protein QBC36DRAFT_347232 [Podospora setosa]
MEWPFPTECDTSHGHDKNSTQKPFDSSPMDGQPPVTEHTLSAEKAVNSKDIVDLTDIENDNPLPNPDGLPAERDANNSFSYGPPVTVVPSQFTARSPGRPPAPTRLHQGHIHTHPQVQIPKFPVIGGKPGLARFSGRNLRNRVVSNPLDVHRASSSQSFRPFPDDYHTNSNGPAAHEPKPPSPRPPFQPQPFPDPPSPKATPAHVTHPQPAHVYEAMSTGFAASPLVLKINSPVKLNTLATKPGYHGGNYSFENIEEFPDEMHKQRVPEHHLLPSDFAISSPQVTPQVKRTSIHLSAPRHTVGGSRSSRSSRGHRHSGNRLSHRHRVQPSIKPFRKSASESKSEEAMRKVRAQSHSSNISRRRDAPDIRKVQQQHIHQSEKSTAKSVTSSPELKQHTVRVRHKFASSMAEVLDEFNMNQETALQKQRKRYREKVKSLKLELERATEESSLLAARSSEKSKEIKELQVSEAEKNARIEELQAKVETLEKQNTTLAEKFAAFKSRCSSIIEEQRALYTDTKVRCEDTITEVRNIAAARISEAEVAAQKAQKVRKALMERVHQDISQNKKEFSELYEKIRALTQQVEEKDQQITRDQDIICGLSTRIQDIQASSEKFEKLAIQNEEVLRKLEEQATKGSSLSNESAKKTSEWLDSISHQLQEVSQTVATQPGLMTGLGEVQTKSLSDINAKLEAMLVPRESLSACIKTQIWKVLQRLDSQFDTMSRQLAQKAEEKAIASTLFEEKKTRCEALEQEVGTLQQTSKEQAERINALQQNIFAMETQHCNDQEEIQRLNDVDSQLEDQKEKLNDELESKVTMMRELEDKLRVKEEMYSTEVRAFGTEVSKLNQALREQENSNQTAVKQAADTARSQVKVEMDRIILDMRRQFQQAENQRDTLAGEIKVLKGTLQEKESRAQIAVKNAIETARKETRIDMERAMSEDQKLLSETQKQRDNLITEVKKLEEANERQQAAQAAIQEASDTARRKARAEMERDISETTKSLHEAQMQMDTLKGGLKQLERAIEEKEQEEQQGYHLLDSLKKTLAAEEASKKKAIQESTERLAEYNQQVFELKARVASLEVEGTAAMKSITELESARDQQRARYEALAAGLIDWAQQSGLATDSIREQFESGKIEEIKACVLQTLAQLSLSQRLKAADTAPSTELLQSLEGSSEQAGNSQQGRPQNHKETANMGGDTTLLESNESLTVGSPGTWEDGASATLGSSPSNEPRSQRRRLSIQTPMSEPDPVPPSKDQYKIQRREVLQPKSILRHVTRSASSGRLGQENINGISEPGTSPDPLRIQHVITNVATPTRPKPVSAAAVKPAAKRPAKRKAPANPGNRPKRPKSNPSATPAEHPISALGGTRTLSLEPESPGQQSKLTGAADQTNPSAPGRPYGASSEKSTPLPNGAAFQPVNAGGYGTRRWRGSLSPTFETDTSGLSILRSRPRYWSRPQEPRTSGHTGGYQDSIHLTHGRHIEPRDSRP